jgi:hypothetical protein
MVHHQKLSMHSSKLKSADSETNSLVIIEECLDRIYQSRRANLLNKARKFKEKQAKKLYNQSDRVPGVREDGKGKTSENEADEDTKILEELALKFKAPPPAVAPVRIEKTALAKKYEDQDEGAIEVFKEFCDELTLLMDDWPVRLPDDEFRADNCDSFIQKYLTTELDKMMATRVVAKVKKHIGSILEQFSSSGSVEKVTDLMEIAFKDFAVSSKSVTARKNSLPEIDAENGKGSARREEADQSKIKAPSATANVSEVLPKKIIKSATVTVTNVPLKSALKATATAEPISHSLPAVSESTAAGQVDKQKIEKQRIKAQYEQLMAIKKKTENHPDDVAIDQYSALHADIQSVIDSLQKPAQVEVKAAKKLK